QTQHRVVPGQGGIPVEAAEGVGGGAALLGGWDDAHLVDDAEAAGEIGNGAAGVGEDVFDVGGAGEGVAVVQVGDRAGGVDDEVQQRVGQAEAVRARVG